MIKHWINGREVESKDTFINYLSLIHISEPTRH